MIYIGTDAGIYRWIKGTWPIFHSLQGTAVVDLAAADGGVLVAVDAAGRVLETVDNGQNWREVAPPEGVGRPVATAMLGSPSAHVVAAKGGGLWARPAGVDPSAGGGGLRAAEGRAAALVNRTLHRATRGRLGEAASAEVARASGWSPLAGPTGQVRALAAGPGGSLPYFAAVEGQGLWRSDDGVAYEHVNGTPAEVYAVRVAGQQVALATSDGCWVSADGGLTFQDMSEGLGASRHVRALDIKPGNPKVMLAGAAPGAPGEGPVAPRGGLQFALYETKDGGKTWGHVKRGFPEVLEYDTIADIRFDPVEPEYAAVALGSGELWSTRSDGLWWEPLARQIKTARVLCATAT